MIRTIVLLVLIGIVLFALYESGIIATKAKVSKIFIGSMGFGGPCCRARFSGTDGWIKRVVRFRENRDYRFLLEGEIRKGAVTAELQNAYKESVLILRADEENPRAAGRVSAEAGRRYELVVTFEWADGNYQLTWQ